MKPITETYAVSPQISPDDIAGIKAAGYTTVICNRPDAEVPPGQQAADLRAAAEAAGLTFVENPFSHAAFGMELVDRQMEALEAAEGPVFAYCASGNRCTVLWALGQVREGAVSPDEAIGTAAQQGYDLSGLRPQLEAVAPA
ncbi:protein tyrosine phosphatase family protein [Histidinibacterium aquaticum]|uniref:protein tyrosine phosphatase family protein n=1 Tax=Histidinibacterium aquaticum TaxID=2613962 RepID=UPI0021DF6852|nr:protein tyrosine phosphatase family protein [Histidinibacterium aquaticum]